jgi:hypothetical protein
MKQRQNVPLLLEGGDDEPPDEAISANEKNAHRGKNPENTRFILRC